MEQAAARRSIQASETGHSVFERRNLWKSSLLRVIAVKRQRNNRMNILAEQSNLTKKSKISWTQGDNTVH